MFRELVELGRELDTRRCLPPPAFYQDQQPIKWFVHLLPHGAELGADKVWHVARPYSGRTSGPEALLLVDKAAYSLGIGQDRDGEDDNARKKHSLFRALLSDFLASEQLRDPALRSAIEAVLQTLDAGWIAGTERYEEIKSDDWVSFTPAFGPLKDTHLFQHSDAKGFWLEEMRRRCAPKTKKGAGVIMGSCAVCNREGQPMVGKLPLGVRLGGVNPLHSLNKDAFPSFIGGPGVKDWAHLGVCFDCGEIASRAFNYLRDSPRHQRMIVRDPKPQNSDKLTNQLAVFWTKVPAPLRVGGFVLDLDGMNPPPLDSVLGEYTRTPRAELAQLAALIDLPWIPADSALRLDDYGFHLAVLSPNVGRVAVREWISVSLDSLKRHLKAFLAAVRIVLPDGEAVAPVSVRSVVEAFSTSGPNLTRTLLRCAYTGTPPPTGLGVHAGQRLNELMSHEASHRERQQSRRGADAPVWDDRWPHALAAAVKLGLYYGTKEAKTMEEVNPMYRSKAYHCGRLLAVLEVAQQWHYLRRNDKPLKTTMVGRSYGGAASAPAHALGSLWRVASVAHLPEAGGRINQEVESISTTLVSLGGMPDRLLSVEQAEFGLGFYHQRARNRELLRVAREEQEAIDQTDDAETANV